MFVDKVLVLIAMLGLIAFCGAIVYFVFEPDLVVVLVLCLAMAFWDFWVSVIRPHDGKSG